MLRSLALAAWFLPVSGLRLPSPCLARCAAHAAVAGALLCSSADAALAVSGGGKDFSGMGVEGQDFSGQKLSGKEFRGIRGAGANFKASKLDASSFFKADLSNAICELICPCLRVWRSVGHIYIYVLSLPPTPAAGVSRGPGRPRVSSNARHASRVERV